MATKSKGLNIPYYIEFPLPAGRWEDDLVLIAIDPGQTSGVAVLGAMNDTAYVDTFAWTWPNEAAKFKELFALAKPGKKAHTTLIMIEDFRLRPAKATALSWNRFPAVKVIGWVEMLCVTHDLPLPDYLQPAQTKEITNEHLLQHFPSIPNNRHQRDALRILTQLIIKYQRDYK